MEYPETSLPMMSPNIEFYGQVVSKMVKASAHDSNYQLHRKHLKLRQRFHQFLAKVFLFADCGHKIAQVTRGKYATSNNTIQGKASCEFYAAVDDK
jgi:hypothetical protein